MKDQLFKYCTTVFTILFAVFCSFQASAQQKTSTPEIRFTSKPFKEVLAVAKVTHKMIFVDAFANWCAPCRELRRTTFKDARAAAYFNNRFINYSVDVEKGEGVDLAKGWQIEALPTLLIVDENGKILVNHVGYVDGNGLMEFAQEAFDSKP